LVFLSSTAKRCTVSLTSSLLDMLLQNTGTYQPIHTASHFRRKYSLITLKVIRSIFSLKPAAGNVKGNQPLLNRCPDVKCWTLKSSGRCNVAYMLCPSTAPRSNLRCLNVSHISRDRVEKKKFTFTPALTKLILVANTFLCTLPFL
jgi:hypothetical protein